jgi:hypothetical protein
MHGLITEPGFVTLKLALTKQSSNLSASSVNPRVIVITLNELTFLLFRNPFSLGEFSLEVPSPSVDW